MDPRFFAGPTVPINELLVPLLTGGAAEPIEYWIRQLDVMVVEDWMGRRALKTEDARRVRLAYQTGRATHDARWAAYVQWQEAERAKERAAKEKERHAEWARVRAIQDKKRRAIEEQNLRDREEAVRVAEEMKGPDFETWSRNPLNRIGSQGA